MGDSTLNALWTQITRAQSANSSPAVGHKPHGALRPQASRAAVHGCCPRSGSDKCWDVFPGIRGRYRQTIAPSCDFAPRRATGMRCL